MMRIIYEHLADHGAIHIMVRRGTYSMGNSMKVTCCFLTLIALASITEAFKKPERDGAAVIHHAETMASAVYELRV